MLHYRNKNFIDYLDNWWLLHIYNVLMQADITKGVYSDPSR